MQVQSSKLSLSPGLEKRVQKVFCEEAKSKAAGPKNAINAKVKNHQRDALEAIEQALTKGFAGGVHGGGSKSFRHSTFSRTRWYESAFWPALSKKYAASSPVSSVFWRKHSTSTETYRKEGRPTLLALFSAAKVMEHRANSTKIKTRYTRKYCYLSWDVVFNTPSEAVLYQLVTEPLVAGVEKKDSSGYRTPGRVGSIDASSNNISLLLFVEGRRPFVRDLSYKFGITLRTEIKEWL